MSTEGVSGANLLPESDPEQTAQCDNCAAVWPVSELDEYQDFWSRVDVGGVVPAGDCPDCGAFCYIATGRVAELEAKVLALTQQRDAMAACLAELMEWNAYMGGWDAKPWKVAKRLLNRHRTQRRA